MRILVTNDDGINAPGLAVAERIAEHLAGPKGEVWVVAPAFEQSGVAHMISYVHPTLIAKQGPRRFAAEGSPADCVIAGVFEIMSSKPDLVISGVNMGNNAGENAAYSGTLGAAMEAAMHDIPAFALSQYLGPRLNKSKNKLEASAEYGAQIVRNILDSELANPSPYSLFYNVNFPPYPADDVQGVNVLPQGRRIDTGFTAKAHSSPSGRKFIWLHGGNQQGAATEGSDVEALLNGYITITPMRADFTAQDVLDPLATQFEGLNLGER